MDTGLSNRVISPSRESLANLRTPLTMGEAVVIAFFDRTLSERWEIYVQPHLNGLRPDVVLLHPRKGVAVYEIKDWDFQKLHYEYRIMGKNQCHLWCRDSSGKSFRQRDEPFAKVLRYRDEILTLYCPSLGEKLATQPGAASAITAGVILANLSDAKARDLFKPVIQGHSLVDRKAKYNTISGIDSIVENRLDDVFPWAAEGRDSQWINENIAADLRSWLLEPDHSESQRTPLPMNAKQRELATTRTTTGYRRVRGPAGSGKSLAIAARAAQLSAENKSVLVISFNITLLHYLRDLAVRYPEPNRSITDGITWLHFHGWCKRTCEEAGFAEEYSALWRKYHSTNELGADDNEIALTDLLEEDLPELVASAIQQAGESVTRYDAILCDEGQDLNLEWWNLLRSVLRPAGEMLLAADRTQDLYGRATVWTETSLENAGFMGGRWFELEGSYRFPPEFVNPLGRFVRTFLPDVESLPPILVQGDMLEPVQLEWVQVRPENMINDAVEMILRPAAGTDSLPPKWSDLAIIAQTHEVGLEIVRLLEKKGIKICHVFNTEERPSRWRKSAFWMGDARVKAATFHSFKGWESSRIFVVIQSARNTSELRGIYVALSRLRRNGGGSSIVVVCGAAELAKYGDTWNQVTEVTPTGA